MIDQPTLHQTRKDDHVTYARQQYIKQTHPDLLHTRFVHHPLPETNVSDIDLHTTVAGLTLKTPFFINAMTGGSTQTTLINQQLARLAKECQLAMATGSMSIAIKDAATKKSFKLLRKENPNGILIANLGAHHHVEHAKQVVDLIEANALQIHLNAAQELVMPEGDRHFSGWLKNIEQIVQALPIPIIVKEVGFGFNREALRQLNEIGVQTVDISGVGGTNFATIEQARRDDFRFNDWNDWGQSTVISLLEASQTSCEIIASGGIHTPLDIAKCLALGATAVGISGEFLHLVTTFPSLAAIIQEVNSWKEQLSFICTLVGAKNITELQKTDLILPPTVAHWCQAREINWQAFANRRK